MDINTGALIKSLRVAQAECGDQNYEANCTNPKPTALSRGSTWVANHFGAVTRSVPLLLDSVNLARSVLGDSTIRVISEKLNQWTGRLVPVWNPYVPKVSTNSLLAYIKGKQLVDCPVVRLNI